MRVLVADDEADNVELLVLLLQAEFGCQAFAAGDGAQALQLALAERPDVLVLDIHMPGLGGIDVARHLRQVDAGDTGARPLLIAMTGRADIAAQLVEIDGSFDDAFAKPLDIARFIGRIKRHWQGLPTRAIDARFDLFDGFTRAMRAVLPSMAARGQTVSFDCGNESLEICGDEVGSRSAMYRLMSGLADVMNDGFVVLTARSREGDAGQRIFTASAAGTGELAPARHIEQVLTRLALTSLVADPSDHPAPITFASGVCPISGGQMTFASAPGEGAMFRLELPCSPVAWSESGVHAAGARAWLVDAEAPRAHVLASRLQRSGWQVRRFDTCAEAILRLDERPDRPPVLVLLHDGPGVTMAAAAELHRRLALPATLLLLARAGSALLSAAPADAAFAVRVEPLGPSDLRLLTEHAVQLTRGEEGSPASTWSSLPRERATVLVVDDNEVNRIVASGLVRSLGYEVAVASDGLDAIEHCKTAPPDLVLMDVNMPVLNGLDATRRLRELQRAGRVAPFPIVAATAMDDAEMAHECKVAGMDGFLGKPLRLPLVRNELRRVIRHEF